MKKIRYILAILLCITMVSAFHAPVNANEDINFDFEVLVDQEIADEILKEYADEIAFIEEKNLIEITILDEETVQLLSREASLNLDNEEYRFSEMMTEITLECERKKLSEECTIFATGTGSAETLSVVKDYGILCGMYITKVPVGGAVQLSSSETFSVSVNDEVAGYTIGKAYSTQFSYSISGPPKDTYLNNGEYVTHNMCFAVLYGTICKDVLGRYYIATSSAWVDDHTTYAHLGIPTYCENIRGTSTFYFSNQLQLIERFQDMPSIFL